MDFRPHPLLRSPHLQTLLSSRLVRQRDGIGAHLVGQAETLLLTCRDGVRLQALLNRAERPGAPLVVLLHGWLGRADSPYLRRASTALYEAGFTVARLLLRDHGQTAHLNPDMFHAARIDEVVDACNALVEHAGSSSGGLLGFSLGGNFALRLAANERISTTFRTALAVCPVMDPAAAVSNLDGGWIAYQRYFLNKWRRAFMEKQAAFPDRYDFTGALRLSRVDTLTDYFVSRHTEFRDARDYYSHYTVTGRLLSRLRMPVKILAAEDDPVVPAEHFRRLSRSDGADLLTLTRHGGHCGYIKDFSLASAVDAHALSHFAALN